MLTVEYCLNNVDATTRRRLDDIEDENVIETRCLQRCGECYRDSFVVVDGELRTGSTHGEVLSDLGMVDE